MDQIQIVEQFVTHYGGRLLTYVKPGGRAEEASKGELNDLAGQFSAIAHSNDGSGEIRAVMEYEDGRREVRASIKFEASEAKHAVSEIEHHKEELPAYAAAGAAD